MVSVRKKFLRHTRNSTISYNLRISKTGAYPLRLYAPVPPSVFTLIVLFDMPLFKNRQFIGNLITLYQDLGLSNSRANRLPNIAPNANMTSLIIIAGLNGILIAPYSSLNKSNEIAPKTTIEKMR